MLSVLQPVCKEHGKIRNQQGSGRKNLIKLYSPGKNGIRTSTTTYANFETTGSGNYREAAIVRCDLH